MVFTVILSFFAISLQAQTSTKTLKLFAPPDGSASDSILVWRHDDSAVRKVSPNLIGGSGAEPWNVANTATPATQNSDTIYQTGNVGIGNYATSKPLSKLEINGSSTNTVAINLGATATSITVDFSQSNLAYFGTDITTATPTTIVVNNMKNGGTYSLLLKTGTGGVTHTFTGTSLGGGTLAFHAVSTAATVTNMWTLYTFIVMGTDVVYWMTNIVP